MDSGMRRRASYFWLAVLVLVAVAAAAYAGKSLMRTVEAAAPAQDITRIDSRLSQLEQRFYLIEMSIRRFEQQARLPGATTGRNAQDPEVGLLRAEVETLRLRLTEVECGLARVDERTLTPAMKEARRKSTGGSGDPCRLNAEAPLRLSARP